LIVAKIYFAFGLEWDCTAVDDWHNTKWFLSKAFFKLTDSWIPSGTFDLETEDVGTFFDWWKISFPVEFLEYISLDIELVQLGLLLSAEDLLCGSKE
jgi:hypothetical protein